MKSYDWHNIRARLVEAVRFVPEFARHPVRGMKTLPDWDWPTILILQACLAAVTASLGGAMGRHWVLMVTSLIVAPITYVIVNAIVTGFFFLMFKFVFQRDVPFRQIWLSAVFASLPGQLLIILTPLVPTLSILGALTFSVLIYVTFVETFHLPRKPMQYFLGVLFVAYAGLVLNQAFRAKSKLAGQRLQMSPESMDILENELKPKDAK